MGGYGENERWVATREGPELGPESARGKYGREEDATKVSIG